MTSGGGGAQWNNYLSIGGATIGVRFEIPQTETSTTILTRYYHKDHLTSVAAITDETGKVVERLSYDAWGKRRFPNGTDDPTGSITSQTNRGFTSQEQLDLVGLIHMNARVYDPFIARFLSPDSAAQDVYTAQNLNHYSYATNNPLRYVDPTGHWDEDPPPEEFGPFLPPDAPSSPDPNLPLDTGSSSGSTPIAPDAGGDPTDTTANVAPPTLTSQSGFTAQVAPVDVVTGNFSLETGGAAVDPSMASAGNTSGSTFGSSQVSSPPANVDASGHNSAGPELAGYGQVITVADNGKFANGASSDAGNYATGPSNSPNPLVALFLDAAAVARIAAVGIETAAVAVETAVATAAAAAASFAAVLLYPNSTATNDTYEQQNVIRGGQNTAQQILNGSGVTVDGQGKLQGVSVQSFPNTSVQELSQRQWVPHNQIGVTTLGQVRALGGDVVPDPLPGNPYHATLSGITAGQAQQLLTPTIPNLIPIRGFADGRRRFEMSGGATGEDNKGALLSDEQIAEIRRRCDEATPGPWKSYLQVRERMSGDDFIMTQGEDIYLSGATAADQDFIANAREDIPRLLNEIERLKRLISR